MTRIVAWLAGTLGALFLLFGYHTSTSATMQALSAPAITGSTSGATGGSTSGSASGSSGAGTGGTGASGGAGGSGAATGGSGASGTGTRGSGGSSSSSVQTFTGDTTLTRYGPVQVELTVQDGSISSVSVLQYPNSDGRDQQISSYALPQLIDETVKAQSAQIDMISGASYTSQGYIGSLQSALDQAGL